MWKMSKCPSSIRRRDSNPRPVNTNIQFLDISYLLWCLSSFLLFLLLLLLLLSLLLQKKEFFKKLIVRSRARTRFVTLTARKTTQKWRQTDAKITLKRRKSNPRNDVKIALKRRKSSPKTTQKWHQNDAKMASKRRKNGVKTTQK